MTQNTTPIRFAAPAPLDVDAVDADELQSPEADELRQQVDLDEMCEAWAHWCRTRRLYVRPSLPTSLLGKLVSKSPGKPSSGGPDAMNSAELAAFHIAFLAQPEDALDRRVFELHYYRRVRNVKAAAAAVGVSRQHWYRLVADCRQRIYMASKQLLARNLAQANALPSRAVAPQE